MPMLSKDFGLLPWHFGGDQTLTWEEAAAFVDAAKELAKARKDANAKAKRGRRRR